MSGALHDIPVPTLVVHASGDPLLGVDSSAVPEGHPRVTRRICEGGGHEPHDEPHAGGVLDDVVGWARSIMAG